MKLDQNNKEQVSDVHQIWLNLAKIRDYITCSHVFPTTALK